jgi:hypothetical protein
MISTGSTRDQTESRRLSSKDIMLRYWGTITYRYSMTSNRNPMREPKEERH